MVPDRRLTKLHVRVRFSLFYMHANKYADVACWLNHDLGADVKATHWMSQWRLCP